MKTGKTIVELAQELERVRESAKDYIVPVSKLSMNDDGSLKFKNGKDHDINLNSWSSQQVANFADIPKQYFDRLQKENSALLASNVNHGFLKFKDESRMIRTVNNHARAFLSPRYRRLDSYDLLTHTLPIMLDNKFKPLSCEITERRLYVKAVTDKIQGEVKVNDVIQYGVLLSTSDVGAGALKVEPFFYRLACLNGMIMEAKMRTRHLGRNLAEGEDIQELFSDTTRELDERAFFAKIQDVLLGTMKRDYFDRELAKFKNAATVKIENYDLQEVVELSSKAVGITGEETKKGILAALASGNEGAGLTQWGLANAFTRAASLESIGYDEATELERAGGDIINLNQSQWKKIAVNAA